MTLRSRKKPRKIQRRRQGKGERLRLDRANRITFRFPTGVQPLGPCPYCNGEDH